MTHPERVGDSLEHMAEAVERAGEAALSSATSVSFASTSRERAPQ
jgi:hypothetical protein